MPLHEVSSRNKAVGIELACEVFVASMQWTLHADAWGTEQIAQDVPTISSRRQNIYTRHVVERWLVFQNRYSRSSIQDLFFLHTILQLIVHFRSLVFHTHWLLGELDKPISQPK